MCLEIIFGAPPQAGTKVELIACEECFVFLARSQNRHPLFLLLRPLPLFIHIILQFLLQYGAATHANTRQPNCSVFRHAAMHSKVKEFCFFLVVHNLDRHWNKTNPSTAHPSKILSNHVFLKTAEDRSIFWCNNVGEFVFEQCSQLLGKKPL